MPVATSTITQTGQVTLPKVIRDILGVTTSDQVSFLSDGTRVEIVAVPKDPLTLGSEDEFRARVAEADVAYARGDVRGSGELTARMREKYGL